MRRFKDYDPFAWLYTNYWGEEFHREAIPVLDRLILHLLPPHAAILDLCCGDGRITQSLVKRGYHVTGLDGSECMLAFARQRNPKTQFYLEDARRFSLPQQFDAVISTFDSLNHVMETADLKKVFESVYSCLKPGGYFAFDLNREEAYIDQWSRTSHIVDRKTVSVARGSYDSARKIAVCDVTVMRLEGDQWSRNDFRMTQRLHQGDDVMGLLEACGFEAKRFDASKNLGMQGEIGQGRDFYLARRST